ncbi:hypothetical protein GQ42DRAFT_163839 [Ramicandelaber brevisporus]|nr:hypothetical protein GQ42DRAFT_163839 [Ramicandelaber brevisporus]
MTAAKLEDVSSRIGKYLLQGWTLLGDECSRDCGTPLMKERGTTNKYCVACDWDKLQGTSATSSQKNTDTAASSSRNIINTTATTISSQPIAEKAPLKASKSAATIQSAPSTASSIQHQHQSQPSSSSDDANESLAAAVSALSAKIAVLAERLNNTHDAAAVREIASAIASCAGAIESCSSAASAVELAPL